MSGSQKHGCSDSHSNDDMPRADFEHEKSTASTGHKSAKPCASDLNPGWCCIFDCTVLHFYLQLSKENPYPDDVQLDQWAVKAWHDALEDLIAQAGYHGHTAPTEAEVDLVWNYNAFHCCLPPKYCRSKLSCTSCMGRFETRLMQLLYMHMDFAWKGMPNQSTTTVSCIKSSYLGVHLHMPSVPLYLYKPH